MRTDRIREEDWPRYLADYLATDERTDFSVVIDIVHDRYSEAANHAFARETSPHGEPWPEYEWRYIFGPDIHPTLGVTGRLQMSIIRGQRDNIDVVQPKFGEFGSAVPYAGVNQHGGLTEASLPLKTPDHFQPKFQGYKPAGAPIDIQPRPFLDITENMATAVAEDIADFLVQQLEG